MSSELEKAKKWFEQVTEADSKLIGFMGISEAQLIEMYEREVAAVPLPFEPTKQELED